MTTKEFFTGRAIVFTTLLVLIVGFVVYQGSSVPQGTETQHEAVAFAWSYEKAESKNLDGLPNTDVVLAVTYADGSVIKKVIDTTPGGCNDLPENDADSVQGSESAQCYSAGLGYRYKVTKGPDSYRVERKTFEEGQPDYTPPLYQYEVIAEFPFLKQ